MPLTSLRYEFRQPFNVPAQAAYNWCTDFRPSDGALFEVKWKRAIRRLSDDALVLTDTTFPKGRARRIQRLVRLNPTKLSWTNTHLNGPFRHSQYWYRVVPDGPRRSHLEFIGMRLIKSPNAVRPDQLARLTEKERLGDSGLWRRRMAPALESEFAKSAGP
jgi:hypothetical protein